MKKYCGVGVIPLTANATIKIEAENEEEAIKKLKEAYNRGEIDLIDFDGEGDETWFVEEV